MSFDTVTKFEQEIAQFYGAPYAVAVDCCTHGLELCLRYFNAASISSPRQTYISVPLLAGKLNIDLIWKDEKWEDFYYIHPRIIDAAVLWKKDSYIPNTFMCLSFQYAKHLSLGRGGMILCSNKTDYLALKKMSYDGRLPDKPWREQNISSIGYHYYMTPEIAQLGLDKLPNAIMNIPKQWSVEMWPDVSKMNVFK